ncbi:MAG: exo-beta-N-acetylmuramidase NamZ domain-containing protein [Myxococcota bacterium]
MRSGLDRIAAGEPEAVGRVRGRSVGLVAHPASVDAHLRHARDVLVDGGAEVGALFGPEHGYGGEAQDMVGVRSARDPRTGAPIHSLYGEREEDLAPRPEWLDGLDAMVVDLQDVGSRYYTYVWTAALVLRTAAARGIPTVVLDRPNPLGGDRVEGAPQRPGYRSFVGLYDVAVRHGMTLAELLELVRHREGLPPEALEVVPMAGWQRRMRWEDTGLPWVAPSPNMPTPDTARVYSGGCLLEGTLLSEGRGTTRPFEIWGAPSLDGVALARALRIEGAVLRPLTFQPMFQKHAGRVCGGVQVHVTDAERFRPYAAYLRWIAEARRLMSETFRWRTEPYEFVSDRPAIDLLTGGPEYRQVVDRDGDLEGLLAEDARAAAAFDETRRPFLRYP